MSERGTYKCGHEGEVPGNMGRGQARQKRIVEHFAHNCGTCHAVALRKTASELCVIVGRDEQTGKYLTRRYNEDEQRAWLAKHKITL